MFSHEDIWNGIDRLATAHDLSTSGLAKKAGLDPTTFNKSKRQTPEGKPRWPSTESLSKILSVTGATLSDLTELIESKGKKPSHTADKTPFSINNFKVLYTVALPTHESSSLISSAENPSAFPLSKATIDLLASVILQPESSNTAMTSAYCNLLVMILSLISIKIVRSLR